MGYYNSWVLSGNQFHIQGRNKAQKHKEAQKPETFDTNFIEISQVVDAEQRSKNEGWKHFDH